MWNTLQTVADRPWMGIYLRVLAVVIGYGSLVHVGNIAGFGEVPWLESPLSWRVGDLIYGSLDLAVAVGLWRKALWGILGIWTLILSQVVLYTIWIDAFAFTLEQRQTIAGLLGTEALLLVIFVGLLLLKR